MFSSLMRKTEIFCGNKWVSSNLTASLPILDNQFLRSTITLIFPVRELRFISPLALAMIFMR